MRKGHEEYRKKQQLPTIALYNESDDEEDDDDDGRGKMPTRDNNSKPIEHFPVVGHSE